MSASPVARQAVAQAQPQSIPRRIQINSPAEMPHDYSTTPGGTMFSTTPGGTRIIYERTFLLQMRNSPLAKSPPKNLPVIPGVTSKDNAVVHRENGTIPEEPEKTEAVEGDQFEMDL
ncbi:eukaryotic translation initiation factor 4E-binding protein 1-like [Penaeus chinensis]|uniref:eukaryotic translation initiation factor 4E-binding protein 1-like n=1 Tax=Penaeus chinensis TaxID=139456 RepID=UPI001FB6F7BA|nr:eukaryotic translation initiation factor 4E-binding protein 1-like [Penaeus chinensis]